MSQKTPGLALQVAERNSSALQSIATDRYTRVDVSIPPWTALLQSVKPVQSSTVFSESPCLRMQKTLQRSVQCVVWWIDRSVLISVFRGFYTTPNSSSIFTALDIGTLSRSQVSRS